MMLRSELQRSIRKVGLVPDRNLGQNFLVNRSIAARIAAEVGEGSSVLEIGPGFGSLTRELVARCGRLTVVEISRKMSDFLRETFEGPSLHVVTGDFLKTDPSQLPGHPFDIVAGNLPYSISSPSVFRLLEDCFSNVGKSVLMLQREVADRLTALDGGREYGKLSLQIWPVFTAEKLLDADPGDFYPEPRVRSRAVLLRRREEPVLSGAAYERFRRIVRVSFSMRRKTILNNLRPLLGREKALELLEGAGVDPGLRAEQVRPEQFAAMAGMMT